MNNLPYRTFSPWTVAVLALFKLAHNCAADQNADASLERQEGAEATARAPERYNIGLVRPRDDFQQEFQPYTFKAGDFRLLVTPSLELDWNDNVTLSEHDQLNDLILRPLLQLDGSYPISHRNVFRFNIGLRSDQYFQHDQFSAFRLQSGSELSLDMYIKDFWFNVHDRFRYVQDPAEQAAVAATGRYGGLDNKAGITTTWDANDAVLTIGYDHENFISSSADFDYLNRGSELPLGRAGFRLHPTLIVGFEAAGAFTTYDRHFLNDNTGYSTGMFAEWRPGAPFKIEARGGYTALLFQQTSDALRAMDRDTWYANVSVSHDVTEGVSYSLSAGHGLRLGTQADSIEEWYIRPTLELHVIKYLTLKTYVSYEHGDQGQGNQTGALVEKYDWLGANISVGHPITKNLAVMLNYRITFRFSDVASRGYTQNLVGLRLAYEFQ